MAALERERVLVELLPAAVVVRGAVVTVAEDAAVCAETWMAERSVMARSTKRRDIALRAISTFVKCEAVCVLTDNDGKEECSSRLRTGKSKIPTYARAGAGSSMDGCTSGPCAFVGGTILLFTTNFCSHHPRSHMPGRSTRSTTSNKHDHGRTYGCLLISDNRQKGMVGRVEVGPDA